MENTDNNPVSRFSLPRMIVPTIPIKTLNTSACPVVILPAGIGRSLVRFINRSRSFSMISLNPLAAPVTKNPPSVKITQLIQLISPCCLLPIKKEIDAEKTTRNVSLSFINFLKSDMKLPTSPSLNILVVPAQKKNCVPKKPDEN